MKKLLIAELDKAFANAWFFIMLAVGIAFAVVNAVPHIIDAREYIDLFAEYGIEKCVTPSLFTCFTKWMSVVVDDSTCWLFYRVAPLMACIPYSWTLGKELDDHYFDQLAAHNLLGKIFAAKYIAAFSVGFVVVALPQLLNFLLEALFLPALLPDITKALYIGIFEENLFSDLFYSQPLLYVFAYTALSGTICGLWSGFVLALSGIARSRVVTIIAPYLVLLIIQFANENIFMSLMGGVRGIQISLFENLRAMTNLYIQNGWVILAECAFLLLAAVALLAFRSRRNFL